MSEHSIGNNLARIMEEKLITQAGVVELTRRLGRPVSKRTIGRILAGDRKSHRHDTLKDLAAGLGVRLEDLLAGTIAPRIAGSSDNPEVAGPSEGQEDAKVDPWGRDMIRVPLQLVKSTRDLEIAFSAPGLRLERNWLESEEAEDRIAHVFQRILDGREQWNRQDLIERRATLKEILGILQEDLQSTTISIDLFVGFTCLSVIDRRGEHLGEGKLAIVVADSALFGTPGPVHIDRRTAINIDDPVEVVS